MRRHPKVSLTGGSRLYYWREACVITEISGQKPIQQEGNKCDMAKKGQLNFISLSDFAILNRSHIIMHMIQLNHIHVKRLSSESTTYVSKSILKTPMGKHKKKHPVTPPEDLEVIEVTFLFGWPSVSCGSVLLRGPT